MDQELAKGAGAFVVVIPVIGLMLLGVVIALFLAYKAYEAKEKDSTDTFSSNGFIVCLSVAGGLLLASVIAFPTAKANCEDLYFADRLHLAYNSAHCGVIADCQSVIGESC